MITIQSNTTWFRLFSRCRITACGLANPALSRQCCLSPAYGFVLAVFLLLPNGAAAQRDLKNIPDPDPELERKTFQLAEGFEVNLFAADPKIAKPIQMNFDPQGRLWIASSEIYPHIKPGQKANDKVLILEDTNGDGVSDKTTVFADGLLIPTGVLPGDGGVYVANSTELLHFADTNGDGKADTKRIVLSGFGTEDTHHILHTLRWGPEGLLYMNQSIYIHSHIETPYGVRRLNAGGIWQFRPETMRLEVYARGWVNSWGHHFDEYGQSFTTDGAGGEGINYVVPGAGYPTVFGMPRILHGLNPGSPKYCGMEIVGGRHLPDDWQNNILTNDFRGNRVCRFVISEDGSGFASRQKEDLIKSTHIAFRPIDVKMGPDGAIYIADWYNPIIQHGEVDFRDPRRDHVHGRIWRVTYKGRKPVSRPKLVDATAEELLDHLKSPEMWTRHNAKRVLKERGAKKVIPHLGAWVNNLDETDPLVERHRLEALWMYQALLHVEPKLLGRLLESQDHRIRAAATRVVQHWQEDLPNPLELLTKRVSDSHPRVRLEAVRVLGNFSDPQAIEIAMRALDQPVDRFLEYALWLTAWDRQSDWLPLLTDGKLSFDNNVSHLTFALKSTASRTAVTFLIKLLQEEKVSDDQTPEVLEVIAALGGPNDLKLVFDSAVAESTGEYRRTLLFSALAAAAQKRNVRPAGDLSGVETFLNSENESLKSVVARCAGLWKLESLRDELAGLATKKSTGRKLREAAIEGLAFLGGPESRKLFVELADADHAFEIRRMAVAALSSLDLKKGADVAVAVLADAQANDDPTDIFNTFLQRKQGPAVLAQALSGRKISPDTAKIGLRIVSSSGREEALLTAALTNAGGITSESKTLSPGQLQKLMAEVNEHGNAAEGETVFRRSGLACLKCHAIGGAGGRVGPDLVSLGSSAQVDYLIESLLEPNKKVKENYQTLVVATLEGKVFTGVKVRQTDTDLILRDTEDRELSIPLKQIDEQISGKSIMPGGLTEKLTRRELVDLVRFLSELGKVGKFAVGRERVVRTWRVMSDTPEARFRLRRTSYEMAATDDPAFSWNPVYSNVGGLLPMEEIPDLNVRNRLAPGARGVAFLRCRVNVTTPGKVKLILNGTEGLSLWVGTVPTEIRSETLLDLEKGTHRLTFSVDLSLRKTGLRIELVEPSGSPAIADFVNGK
ncbi:MAG: HEAT repeat domain-containing protein [Planctomycetes bacterium]|nr:HEAT repeat domain-containing protein [Planctomycetota bacterium]